MNLEAIGKTNLGHMRHDNEDDFLVRKDIPYFVVADGMGGATTGELASHIFIKSSEAVFEKVNASPEQKLMQSFTSANRNINDYSRINRNSKGMGCTADVLTFKDSKYLVGHIGDSRTYLVRNNTIKQLTSDHTYDPTLNDFKPELSSSLSSNVDHGSKKIIYRAVGHMQDNEIDVITDKWKPNDVFLICSDGLSDLIDDQSILSTFQKKEELNGIADNLIYKAKQKGGKDNITVVLIKINE